MRCRLMSSFRQGTKFPVSSLLRTLCVSPLYSSFEDAMSLSSASQKGKVISIEKRETKEDADLQPRSGY